MPEPLPSSTLAEAQKRLHEVGLPWPPIPAEMATYVQSIDSWIYGTRSDEPYLYELDWYVNELLMNPVGDYLLMGHSGRGINSWAFHYYLVRGPLAIFIQVGWGGALSSDENNEGTAALLNRLYADAQRLLDAADKAETHFKPDERLIIVASDFSGSRWTHVYERMNPRWPETDPQWHTSELLEVIPAAINELANAASPVHQADATASQADLYAFLKCEELDDLAALMPDPDTLSPNDRALIQWILDEWDEEQAVANLLMMPTLIAPDDQEMFLSKALRADDGSYFMLASIIGLSELSPDTFTDTTRREIAEQLLRLMSSSIGPIAQRASIAIADYLEADNADKLLVWLDQPNEIMRHNALVALISILGLEATRAKLRDLIGQGVFSLDAQESLAPFLAEMDRLLQNVPVAPDQFLQSRLSTPLLPYLPDLEEWQEYIA
jgi:hypothetical protein